MSIHQLSAAARLRAETSSTPEPEAVGTGSEAPLLAVPNSRSSPDKAADFPT